MSHKTKVSGPEKIATIEKYLRSVDSIYTDVFSFWVVKGYHVRRGRNL